MIRFKKDAQLEFVDGFDEATEHADTSQETFKAGELVDADVIHTHQDGFVDLESGKGGVAFHVDPSLFELVLKPVDLISNKGGFRPGAFKVFGGAKSARK